MQAFANTLLAPVAVPQTGGITGAAGLAPLNAPVSPPNLGLQGNILPALGSALPAPASMRVELPGSSVRGLLSAPASAVETSPRQQPPKAAAAGVSASALKSVGSVAVPPGQSPAPTVKESLTVLDKGLKEGGQPAASPVLRRFFDGGIAQPEAAGVSSESAPRRRPNSLLPAKTRFDEIRELRDLLGDGTLAPVGRIEPFGFFRPDASLWRARSAGMEGFYYTKLELERSFGEPASAAQLKDYFAYLDDLLSGVAWTAALRDELKALRQSSMSDLDKNRRLNAWLKTVVTDLQGRLSRVDGSGWGRNASIYMILARAYNRLLPGKNFFDSIDDAELDRIRRDTRANTLYLLDIFEIGEINRWGTGGGSPFAIKGYRVKPELGGGEALRRLSERAHKKGMRVMVDYIPNHTSLDSAMMKSAPEGFIHLVPPQPAPGESKDAYKKRVMDMVPRTSAGEPMYYLVETDAYPEQGKRVHKWVLVHHPSDFGILWVDMGQIDYTHPAARAWRVAEARRAFEEFGIDGVRRDMAYFVLNKRFFEHWSGTLRWERDNARGWVRAELDRQISGLEARQKSLGGREYLDEMTRAAYEAQPEAFHIDEAYEQFEALSRSGSHGTYNKIGLFDAVETRDVGAIRAALREVAFRLWQRGAAGLVNYPLSHDADDGRGNRGYAVDRYGKFLRATLAMTLLFRPHLIFNGLELGAPQKALLKSDELHKSVDLGKPIPFDIKVGLNWAAGNPANQDFFRRMMEAAERSQDLFQNGVMEVLESASPTAMVAYSVGKAGSGKAFVAAANFGEQSPWGHFRFGQPLLEGGFMPREDKTYVLTDAAHPGKVYERTGKELLEKGLFVHLSPGDAHLFEIEEK